ncbi:MAG: 3-deoxy-manno-octulosonate cytidylyltransferase [Acidobacteria bacterium]|nr:3-deoxy-manno-octulosonate cytidylyltransferase [Acidobacteriota bacterium]
MRVLGVVPARFQSSRFQGKPLALLGGRPMIQHVYERASESKLLNELVVATDDQRIFDAVVAFGGRCVMTSDRHPSGTDRVAEVAAGREADIVVNIQGDEPFLSPVTLDELVEPFAADPDLPMSTVMRRIDDEAALADPNVVKVVANRRGDALYFSRSLIPFPRRSELHQAFEHIGLYAYRRAFLLDLARLEPTRLEQTEALEQLRVLEHGYRIRVVETASHLGLSVDTPADLARAEQFLAARSPR